MSDSNLGGWKPAELAEPAGRVNTVGKRYDCPTCGTQVICVKPGAGRFTCHGEPMVLVTAKPLPSSD